MPLADAFSAKVHTDLWEPSPLQSLGGRKYYITFTDDATHHMTLTILCSKDEALDAYKAYAAWAHTQHGVHIKHLRSDRGGKFTSGEFTKFLKQQGTERQLTTHDTPQHNGIAESLNCHLVECICALLHSARLLKTLWVEALHFVVWVKNRT
jgi:transposase InsO family protein